MLIEKQQLKILCFVQINPILNRKQKKTWKLCIHIFIYYFYCMLLFTILSSDFYSLFSLWYSIYTWQSSDVCQQWTEPNIFILYNGSLIVGVVWLLVFLYFVTKLVNTNEHVTNWMYKVGTKQERTIIWYNAED